MILDVFSRYCARWTVQHRDSAAVAKALIAQACDQQQIARGQLTVHADRGSSMTSKPVAFLLSDLGLTKTHSTIGMGRSPQRGMQFRCSSDRLDEAKAAMARLATCTRCRRSWVRRAALSLSP